MSRVAPEVLEDMKRLAAESAPARTQSAAGISEDVMADMRRLAGEDREIAAPIVEPPAPALPLRAADWQPGEPLVSDEPTPQERIRLDKEERLQERKREWAMRNVLLPKVAIPEIEYVPRDRQERVEMRAALTDRYMKERGLDRKRAVKVADARLARAKVAQDRERRGMGRLLEAMSVAAMRIAPLAADDLLKDTLEVRKKEEFAALQKAGKATGLLEINPVALRIMFDASVDYWGKRSDIVKAAQYVADQGPVAFRMRTSIGLADPYWMKYVQTDADRRMFLFALSQFSVARKRTPGEKREVAFARGAERVLTAPKRIRELYLDGDENKQLFIDTIHDVMVAKDPITSESIWGRGFYQAIGMVPLLLAAAATGGVGGAVKGIGARVLQAAPPMLVMSAAVAPDMYEEFLRAGIDSKVAKPMALAASLVEGVIEYAQLRGLAPGARLALRGRFAATIPGFVAKHFVGPYAREWTEELAQEFSRLMFKTLADAIDDGEIEVDFSAEVARSMGQMKDMTVALFILMGPHFGTAGVKAPSLWAAEQAQVQVDALEKIGQDAAAAIDAREQEIALAPAPPAEAPAPEVPAAPAEPVAAEVGPEAVQAPEVLPEVPPGEAPAAPTEVPPEVSVPAAKQPWEMTRAEWIGQQAEQIRTTAEVAKATEHIIPPRAEMMPEWGPLEVALDTFGTLGAAREAPGWMYMESYEAGESSRPGWNRAARGVAHRYKHGISRKGITVDAEGRIWDKESQAWLNSSEQGPGSDLAEHYRRLREQKESAETAYDDEYIQRRDEALTKAGLTVIGVRPGRTTVTEARAGSHEVLVKEAISEGKPVPSEVLADYPDLAPTEAPTEAPSEAGEDPEVLANLALQEAQRDIAQMPEFHDTETGLRGQTTNLSHPHGRAIADAVNLHTAQVLERHATEVPEIRETKAYKDAVERLRSAWEEGRTRTDDEIRQLMGAPTEAPPVEAPPEVPAPPKPIADAERPRLRQRIMAVVKRKGLSETQRREITKRTVGVKSLRAEALTADDLQTVLRAMERARPRRVGMKRVITPKTEKKIQTLRERLISRGELTEERFTEQMSELNIKSATYVDARTFLTETQGNELIRKMNEEALVIRPREQARKALAKDANSGLRANVDGIEGTVTARRTKRASLGKLARAFQGKGARYVTSDLQEQTGKPFYDAWSAMNDVHLEIRARVTGYMDRIRRSSPEAQAIMKDAKAAQRVSDYIASKLARNPAAYPKDITAEEIKVAQEIESVFKEFEPLVRLARFMDHYYQKAEIPNAPRASLVKATDIYEGQGLEALKEYLDAQTWGVITKGYEPREAVTRRISFAPPAIMFGKGHIKVRSGDALASDRTIFQRMDSYMRQMLNKVQLEPQARALVRIYDENMDLLANPRSVNKSITLMIEEAKGFRDSGTILDRAIRRLVAQAFRAVFIRPFMSFRNSWQNFAFNEDLAHGDLTNPRNKVLGDANEKYFDERVDQTGPLRQQYLMQEERALPGFKWISRLADRLAHYAFMDKVNRSWAFWGRLNRIRRAVKGVNLADSRSVKRAMDKAGFAGMELLQQRRALDIWARDGVDAMARYAAGEHVMNIHFAYERAQRSAMEMGTTGRIWGSLMAFPRSWAERIYREGRKVTGGGSYTARYRAVGRLIQMTIIPALVGEVFRVVAGKKRNPYNPLNILLWTPGGLVLGAVEALGRTMYLTVQAASGDDNALGQLPATYSRLAKLYVPFYEIAMDVIDASLHGKNLDRKAARKIREAMSESYKVRDSSYEVKRTWVEAFQKAILGGRAAEEKGGRSPASWHREYRNKAAKFILQGNRGRAQKTIKSYGKRHPNGPKLTMEQAEAAARQMQRKRKTR